MIEIQDSTEREYAETLAAHLVSGNNGAYRALHQWGETRYHQRNADLVAWAEDRARLLRFIAEANAAVEAQIAEQMAALEPDPEVIAVGPDPASIGDVDIRRGPSHRGDVVFVDDVFARVDAEVEEFAAELRAEEPEWVVEVVRSDPEPEPVKPKRSRRSRRKEA